LGVFAKSLDHSYGAMKCFIFSVFCFLCSVGFAQQAQRLKIVDEKGVDIRRIAPYLNEVVDSLIVYKEANRILSVLQFKGYVLAEVSTVEFRSSETQVNMVLGEPYHWVNLKSGNMTLSVANAIGFNGRNFKGRKFDISELEGVFNAVLEYHENSGYPFASVTLNDIDVGSEGVSASIHIIPHQQIIYDEIEIVGNGQVGQKFLQSYLNVKGGAVYSERTIAQVDAKLREIQFLTVAKPSEVSFTKEKAKLIVFVNKRSANQFDGIIGLQQNASTGKLQVVGNLKLNLQNTLKLGETLSLNYQGLPNSSQLLDVKAKVPHVLSTSFGFSPSLYMLKQDTSFLNVNSKIGFDYLLKGSNSIQVFLENKSTSLLATEAYRNNTALPNVLDSKTAFYGVGFAFDNLDYRFNPRKGISFLADLAVGSRKIKRNSAIDVQLYDGLSLTSTSYRFFEELNYFRPITDRLVLALRNQSAFLVGKQLLENEFFRLGGQQSLRGFNELSVLATSYSFSNVEMRYLLAQHSFLFAFYNQAYLQYNTKQLRYADFPLGFGAGVNFEMELGILSMSYALGKQRNIPLNLRQGKIHFGITALF
jgi:outer membrane protein assembly factor BamA